MPHAYTEDQLVEQPAITLFAELGWQTMVAEEEVFGVSGSLGRASSGEVVLVPRLRTALKKLNPTLPNEAIDAAVDELTRDRGAMSLASANREIYLLLKDGIKVSVPDGQGGQKTERLRVMDWEHPANNDFLLVSQFSVTGALYTRRPDLVGFVNGLPLVVIELKKPGVPARNAFDDNLTCYKSDIPQLFFYNAFLIASNGTDSRVGSLTADWERFFEWKRIEQENEPRRVSLETILRGTCDKHRLLDILENFTLFSEHEAGLVKIIGQNHQYLGVNNAIASMLEARKLGQFVISTIVVFFGLLGLVNLFLWIAPIPSLLWLAFLTVSITPAAKQAGGLRPFVINHIGDLFGHKFVERDPSDTHPKCIRFGFQLFGHRFIQKCVALQKIESVTWHTGQASSMAGRDMNDWMVWMYFDGGDQKSNHSFYGVGPAVRKDRTEALGLAFVSFLKDAGVDLIQGEEPNWFVRRT